MLSLLVRASLEGAVLAACVWLVCRALPQMSPGVRTLLWWCVAAKFVVALLWLTPVGVPVLPRASVDAPGITASVTGASSASAETAGAATGPAVPAPGSDAPEIPSTAILVGAWALGLGISLLRTLQGWRRTRAVVSRSPPADAWLHGLVREISSRLSVRRTVDIRVSGEVESPVIVGVRRPVILVPAPGFAVLSPDQQRMALCHELAHLKRGDMWLGCVPAAAERFFFFHPLARLAAREYAFWREAACDEAVLDTLGASPQSYGRMLLALGVSRRTATFSAAGAAWSFQSLRRRITMLERTSSSSIRGRALAAGAVAAALLAIAPIKAVARSAAPAAPSQTQTAQAMPTLPPTVAAHSGSPAAPVESPPAATADAAETAERRSQEELQFVFFSEDENTTMSGTPGNAARARRHRRPGEPLLWFQYGGQEYVVRDRGVLRQVDDLWEPVGRIGEEQGRIGAQQGEIGEEQGRIGAQLGEIGERQGRLGTQLGVIGARLGVLAVREAAGLSASERRAVEREREELEEQSRRIEEQMDALDEEMREFDEPMGERGDEMAGLGREMEVLVDQMEAALERANTGMLPLVRRAIESGAAVAVR